MSAPDPPLPPRPHPARRILARACLFACLAALLATPTLFQPTRHDAAIQAAKDRQADHHQRLIASGVSQEARDLHRDTATAQRDSLHIRRRVDFYARAAIHFGATLGLLLAWRTLRQPGGGKPAHAATTPTPRP